MLVWQVGNQLELNGSKHRSLSRSSEIERVIKNPQKCTCTVGLCIGGPLDQCRDFSQIPTTRVWNVNPCQHI